MPLQGEIKSFQEVPQGFPKPTWRYPAGYRSINHPTALFPAPPIEPCMRLSCTLFPDAHPEKDFELLKIATPLRIT